MTTLENLMAIQAMLHAEHNSAAKGCQDFLIMYMLIQQDREERELERYCKREEREELQAAQEAEAQQMHFMAMMASIIRGVPQTQTQ